MPDSGQPAETSTKAAPPHTKSPVALIIRIALISILALLVIGLIYDYQVARPAHKKAWEEIDAMLDAKNTDAGTVKITNKDVAEKFGFGPSSTYKEGRFTVEVYSWRTGLLVTSYPIYVYYEGEDPLRLALANPTKPIEDLEKFENVSIPAPAADATSSPNPPEDAAAGDAGEPEPAPAADATEPMPVADAIEPGPEPDGGEPAPAADDGAEDAGA